jgi:hypothetical protein
MASPIAAQLILCDAAQADPTGKIHMLGAGWSIMLQPGPHAVAVLIKVPWDRANEELSLNLQLFDADGHPVTVETTTGQLPIAGTGTVEVGRPAGIAPGSMLPAAFALNVPALPLPRGRYEWRLRLADLDLAESFTLAGG